MTPIPPSPPVAGTLPEAPDPNAWVSLNVLTQKASVGNMPITALQPGVYQNKKVFSEDQMRAYALSALSAHEAEVGRLRTELGKYANVFNWDIDGQGIRRVWLEPDSTSPTAYNGFESARAALTQGETK